MYSNREIQSYLVYAPRQVTHHNWAFVSLVVNWQHITVTITLTELLYLLHSYFFQTETFLPSGRGELRDTQEIRNLKGIYHKLQDTSGSSPWLKSSAHFLGGDSMIA